MAQQGVAARGQDKEKDLRRDSAAKGKQLAPEISIIYTKKFVATKTKKGDARRYDSVGHALFHDAIDTLDADMRRRRCDAMKALTEAREKGDAEAVKKFKRRLATVTEAQNREVEWLMRRVSRLRVPALSLPAAVPAPAPNQNPQPAMDVSPSPDSIPHKPAQNTNEVCANQVRASKEPDTEAANKEDEAAVPKKTTRKLPKVRELKRGLESDCSREDVTASKKTKRGQQKGEEVMLHVLKALRARFLRHSGPTDEELMQHSLEERRLRALNDTAEHQSKTTTKQQTGLAGVRMEQEPMRHIEGPTDEDLMIQHLEERRRRPLNDTAKHQSKTTTKQQTALAGVHMEQEPMRHIESVKALVAGAPFVRPRGERIKAVHVCVTLEVEKEEADGPAPATTALVRSE